MKLDNIIYDIDTLGSEIQTSLINESATFNAMYPSQTATELVKTLAAYSSMLQYTLASTMANCYTETAFSPTGIYQLAETLGNRLHGNISSQLTCTITRTNLFGLSNIVIPAGSNFLVEGVNFFNKEDVSFPRTANIVRNVTLIQGVRKQTEKISHGIPGERFYFSENFECNTNLVTVTVDNEEWDIVNSFLPITTTDVIDESQLKAFVLRTDPDGRSYLKCGSGANAIIPSSGTSIKISWISNQGSKGNITKSNAEISLITPIFYTTAIGERVQLTVNISESTTAAGGFDTQSLEVLKESSPYMFASGQRCVRRNDYKTMLLNHCGYITCNVWGEYEQAILEGTYNKIMMNMVYYSGIKYIQKYDLIKLKSLTLDSNTVENNAYITNQVNRATPSDQSLWIPHKWYYEVTGNTFTGRGFLGSYNVEISSYDQNNNTVSLVYEDKHGTGILTCDYSTNKDVIDANTEDLVSSNYPKYIIDDLGPDLRRNLSDDSGKIYQYNSYTEASIRNQDLYDYDGEHWTPITDEQATNDLFNTGAAKSANYTARNNTFLFSGRYQGTRSLLLPSNPVQILFSFNSNRKVVNKLTPSDDNYYAVDGGVITGFTFKTPGTEALLKNFIGSFAIYGTNSTILNAESTDEIAFINIKNDSSWVKLTDTITISDNLQPGQWTDWYTLKTFNTETGKWESYNRYMIEIYSFRDSVTEDVSAGRRLAIGEIRASYGDQELFERTETSSGTDTLNITKLPGRSSYIYYNNNNNTTLRIPYNNNPTNQDNKLVIPDNLQYYNYITIVQGATAENGYANGEYLRFSSAEDESLGTYYFRVRIIDNTSGTCIVELKNGQYDDYTRNLFGQKQLTITNGELVVEPGTTSVGSGATINITSDSIATLYTNYLGNFYGNTDTQISDIPVIEQYNHFTTYLEFKQPKIKNIHIDISVEYENSVTANDIKNNVIKAINNLFEVTPYSLGKTFSVSDLWKAVSLVEGVKRLIVNSPTDNIKALPFELISLPATNLTIRDISEYNNAEIKVKD